jgi:hypothetical protein
MSTVKKELDGGSSVSEIKDLITISEAWAKLNPATKVAISVLALVGTVLSVGTIVRKVRKIRSDGTKYTSKKAVLIDVLKFWE